MRGQIARLVPNRNIGFVRSDRHQQDLFFHRGSVINGKYDDLQVGDIVEFVEDAPGPKGLRIKTLEPVNP